MAAAGIPGTPAATAAGTGTAAAAAAAAAGTVPKRALPVAARLVITYGLIVTATLLVVAGVAYDLTRHQLAGDLDARLASSVASFQRGSSDRIGSAAELESRARLWLAEQVVVAGGALEIRMAGGHTLRAPGSLDLAGIPGGDALLRSTAPGFTNLDAAPGALRALVVPLRIDHHTAGTLVVAAPIAEAKRSLSALLFGIGWATAFGVAMATLLGLVAIRRILRPLRRISRGAKAIEATGDLSKRVGGDGPHDEVGRLADAFDAMLAKLEHSFRSQQRFLSEASHELRTPITVARGRLELIQEARPDDREAVTAVVEELDRMARVVNELLLLARLDEGLPMSIEPIEVELVMHEALVRGMAARPHDATVEAEPGLRVLADQERLLQVLTNLVRNAVQHAGEGIRLALAARKDGAHVVITVADDGRGIAPEELPHLFERFYRGAMSRQRTPTGAGLGLAIVASLVEAMDGRISATSAPGEGTTFTIVLPAVTGDAGA